MDIWESVLEERIDKYKKLIAANKEQIEVAKATSELIAGYDSEKRIKDIEQTIETEKWVLDELRSTLNEIKDELQYENVRTLEAVMTTQEAEEKWGLTPGFVRQSITRGKLKSRTGVRKSGKTWLVTAKTMIEVYGEEPKSDDSND